MIQNLVRMVLSMILTLLSLAVSCQTNERPSYVLVIHGGAGGGDRESITADEEAAYLSVLAEALSAGESILKGGGSSLDAVEASVRVMEDSPLFNAGKGAVFNMEGRNELDAAIMCGKTINAGAVACVTTLKNPVTAARKVMENSPHVMLTGKGAEQFGYDQGVDIVPPDYFFDQNRWEQYRKLLRRHQQMRGSNDPEYKMGTVGAVALDNMGNLAAATSTGGMTGKQYGRVGDVPIIGAGTYANNASCAVSATGHGEYFIRQVVAHEVSSAMIHGKQSLDGAAVEIIRKLEEMGAGGGLIAVDKDGNISMPFNTTSMFRGYAKPGGERYVKIFSD